MTFADIFNEVISARFKTSQTPSIKRWINLREAQIWASAEWPWKLVGPTALAVAIGVDTPTVPSDIDRPSAIYDDQGSRMRYLTQTDFDDFYRAYTINSSRGRSDAFKWNNGVLTLGPVPDATYSYTMAYLRRICHYDNTDALTDGPMVDDDDYPVYDVEWHEILTIGAIATGLKVENDPTWNSLEQEFGVMLTQMVEHYLPTVAVAGNTQYGADWL